MIFVLFTIGDAFVKNVVTKKMIRNEFCSSIE